jgi:hypothetical protein
VHRGSWDWRVKATDWRNSMTESLCETCEHLREVVSGSGSRFLLCRLSNSDHRFPKYPPQPVVKCDGYSQKQVVERQ